MEKMWYERYNFCKGYHQLAKWTKGEEKVQVTRKYLIAACTVVGLGLILLASNIQVNSGKSLLMHPQKQLGEMSFDVPIGTTRFLHQTDVQFSYPKEGVRGIYVSGPSAGGTRFSSMVELVENTGLNAMVIDVKDDFGHVTYQPDEHSPFYDIAKPYIKDPKKLMKVLEEKEIYPIARIVVFKDTVLAEKRPDLSFKDGKDVWANSRGEAFVNPFLEEVWRYNVAIAEEAAKMGFREIQFDYVRFPEGFEHRDEQLKYDTGKYGEGDDSHVQRRVTAVTDFVAYAREALSAYNVDVSVDIFGYAATVVDTPGIGQNFLRIAENVDIISAMIYPSHWTAHFGLDKPDLYPYELTDAYAKVETALLNQLKENKPTSRPWIQDFTASYLGEGNYIPYGVKEVEAQIKALYDNDIEEFLLWNAGNNYTTGVHYDNPK
ncbi:putative glycoside hydrolase [Bacillus sp. FSL W7-1360]